MIMTTRGALILRINLVFLSFVVIFCAITLLRYSHTSNYHENLNVIVSCSHQDCPQKLQTGSKTKPSKQHLQRTKKPSFLDGMERGMKIGMVNMNDEDLSEWSVLGEMIPISFKKVSDKLEWKHLFPKWIKEDLGGKGQLCPEIPMPDLNKLYEYMDMVVVKIPCSFPAEGWARDVFRLQLHLVAATMVVKRGRGRTKVVVLSKCRPLIEVFRCDDMVEQEGEWWYYEPEMKRLEQKVSLPFGSCDLALPLWKKEFKDAYNITKIQPEPKSTKLEAYATVLHSEETYVCGAITLAKSLLDSGTNRHLLLLIDSSISVAKRRALTAAGWTIRIVTRIRNPHARNKTYNEYNYTKFRLWQLTDYHKIIFIDADILVLRNLDILFSFPQMTAVGNDNIAFNSGVMVIEPSNCTFMHFMQRTNEIVSNNGGDQGFLNEIFVYWHRLPRRVNFMKIFLSTEEVVAKNKLFAADPPQLYAIHYFGRKPWWCYRDYDCNWDLVNQRVYANDVAHQRWWKVYDTIDERLREHCDLTERKKSHLKFNRYLARKAGFPDEHWGINITDPRSFD